MKAYIVGGAVRDQLLGQPVHDRDWVVVGATPQQMIDDGFKPVGRDFPVFLHPLSGEQYALARTERKAGRGYHGFTFHAAPDVTLEQDLARRDLTLNAMALDPDTGALIDPFGGRADLDARVLRHVSSAFAEDPVRLLRVARFAARWPEFTVAPATQSLLRQLVDDGEVDALVAERVWQEVSRGLMERTPSKMFELLRGCGALARLAPELAALVDLDAGAAAWPATLRVLDAAAALAVALEVRFACLTHRLADAFGTHEAAASALARLAERWRIDQPSRDLAALLLREREVLRRVEMLNAASTLALIERADALRRPDRFERLLQAWQIVAPSTDGGCDGERGAVRLRAALAAAQAVDVATLRARGQLAEASGPAVGDALRAARCDAIAEVFAKA